MRKTLSYPPASPCLIYLTPLVALVIFLGPLPREEWGLMLFWAASFVALSLFCVLEAKWLCFEEGKFVVYRLFRQTLRFGLSEIADIRQERIGFGSSSQDVIQILPRGEKHYVTATGGLYPGTSIDGILALPGVKAEFEARLRRGEKFSIGSRTLRMEGDTLYVEDGELHPERGMPISAMRITAPTMGERFLVYSDLDSLSVGNDRYRSVWQLLLLELPFPR